MLHKKFYTSKKRGNLPRYFLSVPKSDGAGYLTGAQASGAGIDMGRLTIHDSLNTLNVGLIRSVAASVRMGNIVTENDCFAANFTLCHLTHLLGLFNSQTIIAHP